jgi:hypothetical protein
MEVGYWIYRDDINTYSHTLDKEQPVDIGIMNQEDKLWVKARVMLFQNPVEGGQPVGLLGPFGQPYEQGKYYIKILEWLPEEED